MGYTGVHMQHRIAKTYRWAVSMDTRYDGHTHGLPHGDPIADTYGAMAARVSSPLVGTHGVHVKCTCNTKLPRPIGGPYLWMQDVMGIPMGYPIATP